MIARVFNSVLVADNLDFAGCRFHVVLLPGAIADADADAAQIVIGRCEAMHRRANDSTTALQMSRATRPLALACGEPERGPG